MQKVKNVTIRDIADTCGVSIGTVSGVINDRTHIRPEVRHKVLEAVKTLKYNPLKSKSGVQASLRKSVGLVLPTDNTLDTFYSRAVMGLKMALEEHNMNFLLYTLDEVERITADEIYPGKQNLHCDGLVFFCPRREREHSIRTVTEWGIRAVVVKSDIDIKGVPVITDNHVARTRLGLEHLWEKGHRAIGLVSWFQKGSPGLPSQYYGFLRDKGRPQNEAWVYPSAASPGIRFKTWVDRLFGGDTVAPTGVFCDSDQAAVCLVQYLRELGKKVPDDTAVVGVNDDDIARLVMPGITTVHVPVQEMLKSACRLLAQALERGSELRKKVTVIPNRLVVRGSTDKEIAEQPWNWMGWSGESN